MEFVKFYFFYGFLALNVFFYGPPMVQAKQKYALVIGGSATQVEPDKHEFARITAAVSKGLLSKGYQVRTLFGGNPRFFSQARKEYKKYREDYLYIQNLQKQQGVSDQAFYVTPENIRDYFENLIEEIQSGDQVEIHIAAHGMDSCGYMGPFIKSDIESSCTHMFMVFNSKGQETPFQSKKLIEYIKRLEDRGALPTVVFSACYSGRVKQAFQEISLQNTCAYFAAAGNEIGYLCFDNDPEFSRDFTSSAEYVALRYYNESLDQLKKDPYFTNSICFQKVSQHAEQKEMDFSTIETTYWSARSQDETFQSPAMSSLLDFPYFTLGWMQPRIDQQQPLSYTQADVSYQSLIQQVSQLQDEIPEDVMVPYNEAFQNYNDSAEKLSEALFQGSSPGTPEQLRLIVHLQGEVRRLIGAFIRQERILIHLLFEKESSSFSHPCSRSL